MLKIFMSSFIGAVTGILLGIFIIYILPQSNLPQNKINLKQTIQPAKKEVIGFLPYWFINSAKEDYSGSITTLDYFSLIADSDGKIMKYDNPGELEPGYYALTSGSMDSRFDSAKRNNIKLSLTIFALDQEKIERLMDDPVLSANNLITDVTPIMSQYGFTDLNIDIESIVEASPSSQVKFAQFMSALRGRIAPGSSISIDIAPIDFFKDNRLIKPELIEKSVDKIILMAYDYHSPSSYVTGSVAPLNGAGTVAEFDTNVAVQKALTVTSKEKLVLGVPFYGYSWETIDNFPKAAIIPSSAVIVGNIDAEDFLSKCATCSAQIDNLSQEKYVIYKDSDTGTYHQLFYPDEFSTSAKANYANENGLAGLAVWALGYEGNSIINPLQNFLNHR